MRARLNKTMLLSGLVLGAAVLPANATETNHGWSKVVLPAAQQTDVRASVAGHRYRLFVSVPATAAPAEGYPVLYVLDGNAAFPVAAFLARSAANRSEVTGHTAPLVVGIGYPGNEDFDVAARRRDYTIGAGNSNPLTSEGGADRFLDFIQNELKPLVATRYPVDHKRQALFGHSFGGLFVLHALLTRPTSFSTFIASSPSIWWQNKQLLSELPASMPPGVSPRVQISVGAREDDPPPESYPPDLRALIASRSMIPEARNMVGQLQNISGWTGQVTYHELAQEDHGTAWLPAMARGLQFFLAQP